MVRLKDLIEEQEMLLLKRIPYDAKVEKGQNVKLLVWVEFSHQGL